MHLCKHSVFPARSWIVFLLQCKGKQKMWASQSIYADGACLYDSQFRRRFLKHAFIQRRECCPRLPSISIMCLHIRALWRCLMQLWDSTDDCTAAMLDPVGGLAALLRCWFLLRDRSASVISNIHKEFFLQAYRFKTAKLSARHAPQPLRGGVSVTRSLNVPRICGEDVN